MVILHYFIGFPRVFCLFYVKNTNNLWLNVRLEL